MRAFGVAVTAVTCGLVLVACGSGATGIRVPGSPETVRMGAFTQAFDDALPASPARATVVQRFRAGLVLWDRSQTASRLTAPVRDYVTGQALSNLTASLRGEQPGGGGQRGRDGDAGAECGLHGRPPGGSARHGRGRQERTRRHVS
jgi:hypothetical protein